MKSSRKAVLIVLVVAALSAAVVSPAAAAPAAGQPPPPMAPAMACERGTCEISGSAEGLLGILRMGANLALGQMPFQTTADGGTQAILDAQKEITLSLPVGQVTLTNARLQVEVGADGKIKRLNGSADMPFPTFGLLNDVHVVNPARADVGLDLGKNLPDTGVSLQPDRPYLFFNANSFLSVAGRAPGSSDEFSLSFPPGQRLALVIDTVDPVAYLNGQVTLSITDQVALLGGLLESTPLGPYVPNSVPLRERTQFGLSGKFNKDLAESRLTLRGGYMLDAGFLPAQLGIDAQFVNVLGQLTLSRDGALVNGALKSAIEPDKVFDGSVEVEMFIPFSAAAETGYAGVDASLKVPAARFGVGGGAKASAGKYELNGQLKTPFADSELKGKVAGRLPDVAGAVGQAAGTVGTAASKTAGSVATSAGNFGSAAGEAAGMVGANLGKAARVVGSTASKAAQFVGPLAGKAGANIGDYARFGLGITGNTINAGKARLSGDGASTILGTPEM